MKFSGQEW